MKVAVVKERRAHAHRVAASPDSVKRMRGMRLEIAIESGAGDGAGVSDASFAEAGAAIAADAAAALVDADIVLKVQRPLLGDAADELHRLKRGAALIGLLQPYTNAAGIQALAARKNLSVVAVLIQKREGLLHCLRREVFERGRLHSANSPETSPLIASSADEG